MLEVAIIGTGNLALHLFDTFAKCPSVKVVQVIGRDPQALEHFKKSADTTTDFENIADATIHIIAVSDSAIPTVSKYLGHKKGLVVHTSGSVAMKALSDHERYGVFYPLQTFTKDRSIAMNSVPFCLEAHDQKDLDLLKNLSAQLTEKVYEVDSEQRKVLHLAAVFVNNFTNHLYHIGKEICDEKGLPFGILQPLMQETLNKTEQLSPYHAQTGPARRGDLETIENHLGQLKNSEYHKVYEILSASIRKLYRETKR